MTDWVSLALTNSKYDGYDPLGWVRMIAFEREALESGVAVISAGPRSRVWFAVKPLTEPR